MSVAETTRSDSAVRASMPQPTGDVAQARRDLDETGLAIMRGLFTPEHIAALRARLLEQAELEREQGVAFFADPKLGPHPVKGDIYHQPGARVGQPAGDPPFQNVRFLANKDPMFIELCETPAFLDLAAHAIGDAFEVGSTVGLIVRTGAVPQPLHRDQTVLPFETTRPVLLNLMLALGPYRPDQGATRFVPGSHRGPAPTYGQRPDGSVGVLEDVEAIPAEMDAGDVVFFESRVWHGQGTPTSDDPRLSISIIYNTHWWKPHDNYPAVLSDNVYAAMTEAQRALFGFRIVRHSMGAVAPRYPGDPRHNIGSVELPYVPALRHGSDARAVPLQGQMDVW